jgi:hypothetical protein
MHFLSENKKTGRPRFKPTRRMRNTVEICVAGGLSLQETATVLGICQNTLRANFADELQNGRARKFAEILVRLDRAAARGSVGEISIHSCVGRHVGCHWKERIAAAPGR